MSASNTTRAPTAVTWTSPTIADIGPRQAPPATAATAAHTAPAAHPKRKFPFCPFEFKPVKCAKWNEQTMPLPPPAWFTYALPVPPASLLPALTNAEAALWRTEPFNFDIETEWLLLEAEQRLG